MHRIDVYALHTLDRKASFGVERHHGLVVFVDKVGKDLVD
jgi:hypothetical protein